MIRIFQEYKCKTNIIIFREISQQHFDYHKTPTHISLNQTRPQLHSIHPSDHLLTNQQQTANVIFKKDIIYNNYKNIRYLRLRNSLAVMEFQQLGISAFTATSWVQSLVQELKSHQLHKDI